MKKRFLTGIIILFIVLTPLLYNNIFNEFVRFSTPKEAFLKSEQRNTELVNILEDNDIALLIYKENGTYSNSIIEKDSRGWTSLSIHYNNKKEIMYDKGFIYIKEIQGKFVIQTVTTIEKNEGVPTITDTENSEFLLELCELSNGRKILYGFSVFNENFQDGYMIKIGEETISIKD